MNKCPYCGADLTVSENYCIFCMHTLTEKQEIRYNTDNVRHIRMLKTLAYLLIGAAMVCALLAAGLVVKIIVR